MSEYILYSFRRCPYAIRARMVLEYSAVPFSICEVSLKDKPAELLCLSRKERVTVPVLHQADSGFLLEESWEIMKWALEREAGSFDPATWWYGLSSEQKVEVEQICAENDSSFKYYLDRYKYPQRYQNEWSVSSEDLPSAATYFWREAKAHCAKTLHKYELRLQQSGKFLMGEKPCLADLAVMSFVRQFAHVQHLDSGRDSSPSSQQQGELVGTFAAEFPLLSCWLESWKREPLFLRIMDKKYRVRHQS